MSDTTNENIIGMQEDKVKSFIVSVNGEGITTDLRVENKDDVFILDGLINAIKEIVRLNKNYKP